MSIRPTVDALVDLLKLLMTPSDVEAPRKPRRLGQHQSSLLLHRACTDGTILDARSQVSPIKYRADQRIVSV